MLVAQTMAVMSLKVFVREQLMRAFSLRFPLEEALNAMI
jgi:hypothetical protein